MNQNFIECKKITILLDMYFSAVIRADITALKTIFHKQASMNGYLGDNILIGTPDPFYEDLSSKPSMADSGIDCRYVIKSLSVTGNIAEATLLVDNFFGGVAVQDNFHLIKDNGEWYIICKTFTTI